MGFGFGVLRRSSAEFWAMTPRELGAASEAMFGKPRVALSQAMLVALMRDFPDTGA